MNFLDGVIPSMLEQLKYLETLNLLHNNLSGNIPLSYGEMISLTIVDKNPPSYEILITIIYDRYMIITNMSEK
jgi:hypothetical protein